MRSPLRLNQKAALMSRLTRMLYWDSKDLYADLRRDLPSLFGFGS